MLSLTEHNSLVQVLVKASGKNNNKTGCPFKEESVTSSFSLLNKVKSGAGCPIDKGMSVF